MFTIAQAITYPTDAHLGTAAAERGSGPHLDVPTIQSLRLWAHDQIHQRYAELDVGRALLRCGSSSGTHNFTLSTRIARQRH